MVKRSIGWRELEAAGFKVHKGYRRKWFAVTMPQGGRAVMLRQSKYKWHYFDDALEATGSGGDPRRALSGGLGDVIGTDGELRSYCKMLLDAPDVLLRQCAGLYRESSNVYNSK